MKLVPDHLCCASPTGAVSKGLPGLLMMEEHDSVPAGLSHDSTFYPDNESCEECSSKESCYARKSQIFLASVYHTAWSWQTILSGVGPSALHCIQCPRKLM